MKQFWVGVTVLILLLASGAGLAVGMDRLQGDISAKMTEAAAYALEENWEKADLAAGEAQVKWERSRKFVAAFADHGPLETADSLLSELAVYRKQKLSAEYAAVCLCLARQAEAIGESHSLRWWHVL